MKDVPKKNRGLSRLEAVLISGAILAVAFLIVGLLLWRQGGVPASENTAVGNYSDLEDALVFPSTNYTADIQLAHRKFIAANAITAYTIEFNDCIPDPIIAKFALDTTIELKNNDDSSRMLYFTDEIRQGERELKLPAGETVSLPVDFLDGRNIGDFAVSGYRCGSSLDLSGIWVIYESEDIPNSFKVLDETL